MAALADDRLTEQLGSFPIPVTIKAPVKGSTILYAGGLGCLDASGRAVPGATATTLRAAGRIRARYDNSGGSDGDIYAELERGVFRFNNSTSTDEIAQADVLNTCYIVDDQTVAKTDGSSARSVAGKIIGVDADGVWVLVGG